MRHEFTKPTKREAMKRSGGLCEAIGDVYGLPAGQRCNSPLSRGVEFDHYPNPAGDPTSEVLENCVACCPTCHSFKTRKYDIPVLAKGKRISDKHLGIRPPSRIRGHGFHKSTPQHSATRAINRRSDRA